MVTAVDAGARTAPTMRSLSGTTPADAASAGIGIRIDSKGACVCHGEAGAVIGDMRYQEKGTGRQETVSPVTLPITGVTGVLRTLKLTPGQSFSPNLKQFPVTEVERRRPVAGNQVRDAPVAAAGHLRYDGIAVFAAFVLLTRIRIWIKFVNTTESQLEF